MLLKKLQLNRLDDPLRQTRIITRSTEQYSNIQLEDVSVEENVGDLEMYRGCCVVFDDMLESNQKFSDPFFTRGRDKLCDVYYLKQSYFDVPKHTIHNVTSPCDQRKFWKLLKNSFKNDVVQERVFTKYQPAKKHRGAERGPPREAEDQKNEQKHVYGHEIVYFDSPCAETLNVPRSLPAEQHDGVIAISMPGVVPSSSAGAMPPRNRPNLPNWTPVPDCDVYRICSIKF